MKKQLTSCLAIVLILSLLLQTGTTHLIKVHATEKKETTTTFQGDVFKVDFEITSQWNEAYNANVTISNISETLIDDWALIFYSKDKITNLWNGKIANQKDGIYLIDNAVWNQDIPVGGSVSFGFTATYIDNITLPNSYCLSTCEKTADKSEYQVAFTTNSDWGSGYTAGINITNSTFPPAKVGTTLDKSSENHS